ncbi:MAG: hypothetical protein ACLPTB_11460 [Acidimicrobiales bacterium]
MQFSAPADWPIDRTEVTPGLGDVCGTPGVALVGTTVTLSTDVRPLFLPPCPYPQQSPQEPQNGVQIDSGLRAEPLVSLSFSASCLNTQGLTACPATSPDYSILVLKVTGLTLSKAVYVSIGLAGSGTVARAILHSLRAA